MTCFFCDQPVELETMHLIALDARPKATTEKICPTCSHKVARFQTYLDSLYDEME